MEGAVIDPKKDGKKLVRGTREDKTLRDITWLIDDELAGSEQFVGGLATFPPGMEAPFHDHPDAEEINIVLEGEGVFTTPDGDRPVRKGEWQFVPKGVKHAHRNTGSGPFVIVWLYSPPTKTYPDG